MPKASAKARYNIHDSPLFKLHTRRKLADLLHVSPLTLKTLITRSDLYNRRWKHKKIEHWLRTEPEDVIAKDYRPIDIPDPQLKGIQSRIANLLSRIVPPDFLFSPVKGRSYVDNAAYHIRSRAFWSLDVEDYFPSCTANNVERFFQMVLRCPPDVTAIFVRLTTLNECLPQGSPCSPILAYFCNKPMGGSI